MGNIGTCLTTSPQREPTNNNTFSSGLTISPTKDDIYEFYDSKYSASELHINKQYPFVIKSYLQSINERAYIIPNSIIFIIGQFVQEIEDDFTYHLNTAKQIHSNFLLNRSQLQGPFKMGGNFQYKIEFISNTSNIPDTQIVDINLHLIKYPEMEINKNEQIYILISYEIWHIQTLRSHFDCIRLPFDPNNLTVNLFSTNIPVQYLDQVKIDKYTIYAKIKCLQIYKEISFDYMEAVRQDIYTHPIWNIAGKDPNDRQSATWTIKDYLLEQFKLCWRNECFYSEVYNDGFFWFILICYPNGYNKNGIQLNGCYLVLKFHGLPFCVKEIVMKYQMICIENQTTTTHPYASYNNNDLYTDENLMISTENLKEKDNICFVVDLKLRDPIFAKTIG
eukprot:107605_1